MVRTQIGLIEIEYKEAKREAARLGMSRLRCCGARFARSFPPIAPNRGCAMPA